MPPRPGGGTGGGPTGPGGGDGITGSPEFGVGTVGAGGGLIAAGPGKPPVGAAGKLLDGGPEPIGTTGGAVEFVNVLGGVAPGPYGSTRSRCCASGLVGLGPRGPEVWPKFELLVGVGERPGLLFPNGLVFPGALLLTKGLVLLEGELLLAAPPATDEAGADDDAAGKVEAVPVPAPLTLGDVGGTLVRVLAVLGLLKRGAPPKPPPVAPGPGVLWHPPRATSDATSTACPGINFLFMGGLFPKNLRRTGSPRAARFPYLGCAFYFPLKMRRDHSPHGSLGQEQIRRTTATKKAAAS